MAIARCKELNQSQEVPREKLMAGDRLGDFEIVEEIASGGMGVIYLAVQHPLGREVAVKTVIPAKASEFLLERFRRERLILAELHESNVINIFSAGTEGSIEFFAMPFVRGATIKKCLNDADNLPNSLSKKLTASERWRAISNLLIDLADGIQAIHSKNIIHRDVTPNNVMLDTDGRPWLLDFGIATKQSDAMVATADDLLALSTDGRIGAPRYQAPELSQGLAGEITDVFGLGVCFFCLLTGADFIVEEHLKSSDYATKQLASAQVPRPLSAICEMAIAPDTTQRYTSALELQRDLRRWLRNEPVSAAKYRPDQKTWLWLKRNPIKSVLTTAAFTTLAISSYMTVERANLVAQATKATTDAEISRIESKLSQVGAVLVSGNFDAAAEMISDDSDIISNSVRDDPDLFFSLIQLFWRTKGIEDAINVIDSARAQSSDAVFIARLDLAEADVRYASNFEESERLARAALASGMLAEADELYAKGLLANDSVEEQEILRGIVKRDPFHLRAVQLLVMNLIFMGQTNDARLQLASGRALFPDDSSLKLGEAILHQIALEDDQESLHLDIPAIQRVAAIFPRASDLRSSEFDVTINRLDLFLQQLFALQKTEVDKGYVIFPPALYRCLSSVQAVAPMDVNPDYWSDVEEITQRISTCNPNSLFLYAHARTIFQQRERWDLADELLVKALDSNSMFPIRAQIVQQLALLRTHTFAYVNKKTEDEKARVISALEMMKDSGRWPAANDSLWENLPDTAFSVGRDDLAEFFCVQWRDTVENGVASDHLRAMAFGYSGRAALRLQNFEKAISFCSKALEIAPEHQYKMAFERFRDAAISELKKLADDLPDTRSKENAQ